jgi:hypothetical protein
MEELKQEISGWDHIFKADIQNAFVRLIDLLMDRKCKGCCGCSKEQVAEPAVVEPVEEPAVAEPVEEPAVAEPVEEPAVAEPVAEEPAVEEPVAEPPKVILPFHVGGQVTTS